MKKIVFALLLIVCGLNWSAADAMPAGSRTIPDLVAAADRIVIGHATLLEVHKQSQTPEGIFTIVPDRVLKGTLPNGSDPVVVRIQVGLGAAPVQSYGIFFLSSTSNGQLVEAMPGFSSLFAVPHTGAVAPDTDPALAVAEEQLAVLATPASALAQFSNRRDLPTTRRAEFLYASASHEIITVPDAATRVPVASVLQASSDMLSRCWLIKTLMDLHAPVSFEPVKAFLSAPSPDTEVTRAGLVFSISQYAAVRSYPESTPYLIEFVQSPDVELRRAASLALRDLGTPPATGALAQIALRDSDWEVRVNAEQGLCWATKLQTAPCDVMAEKNEEAQHLYWTSWRNSVVP
jgi:hypothetical protein